MPLGTTSSNLKLTFEILSGSAFSNIHNSWNSFGTGTCLWFYSPDPLPEGVTFALQVSPDPSATASSEWYEYQGGDPLGDVPLPAAGKAQPYPELVAVGSLRVVASTTLGANLTFYATFQETR